MHTFTGYPAGVRYVYIESGGDDQEFWNGWYGTIIEQASATVGTWEFSLSNDGTNWDPWVAFVHSTSWNLTAGAGTKTVYVRYRYLGFYEFGPYSDTIELL